jgi:hypothetical protein
MTTTITVANYTDHDYYGWVHCTTDEKPPHPHGQGEGYRYSLGRRIGDVWSIDILCYVNKQSKRAFALSTAEPIDEPIVALPADPHGYFGGATVNDEPLTFVDLVQDGAAYVLHMHGRPTLYLHCDLWLRWYPDHPGIATGEIVTTASNPSIPDMVATVPDSFRLRFGDAVVLIDGRLDSRVEPKGKQIADGQARSHVVAVGWMQHMTRTDLDNAPVLATVGGVVGYGLAKAWPTGNPYPAPNYKQWATANYRPALEALRGWESCGVGVNPRSSDTGSQEDQVFVGGRMAQEPLGVVGRYLAALGQSRRPCHHLEADGTLLDLDGHPHLALWDGRPHYLVGMSPDRRGKPRHQPTLAESHGWHGPDIGHWLINSLATAHRATGSPALQWQLENHARLILFWQRRPMEWSPGWLRDVGWKALAVWHLWHNLEDRVLAQRVVDEWDKDADHILAHWTGEPWWWEDSDDPRPSKDTGWPRNAMVWQHGVASYFLDLCGETFGRPDLRQLAHYGAKACCEHAFTWDEQANRHKGWGYIGTNADGTIAPLVEGNGAHWGSGVEEWMALTPATVLRNDPGHVRARLLFAQFRSEAKRDGKWLPCELLT